MTIVASGPISMNTINAEFGFGNNLNNYRGQIWWTDSGQSGFFSQGQISMSDFYSKRYGNPFENGGDR
jgi:hypothetical protein